jgi:hypothetical protein
MQLRRISSWLVAVIVLALLLAAPAGAQQQPEQEKERPKRAKRVWTNEDVKDLRTPADEYLRQREAAAAAAAEKQQAPAAGAAENGETAEIDGTDGYIAPKTVEEAEVRVADKRDEIRHTVEAIRQLREEYFRETDDQTRGTVRGKIERSSRDLDAAEKELERLEGSLEELRSGKAPAAQAKASPPQP